MHINMLQFTKTNITLSDLTVSRKTPDSKASVSSIAEAGCVQHEASLEID